MELTYQTHVRSETDPAIIANLTRKGWVENPSPSYNADTHRAPQWNGTEWVSVPLTADELSALAEQTAADTERAAVKSLVLALKAGTGTAAERLTRLERCVAYLLKASVQ